MMSTPASSDRSTTPRRNGVRWRGYRLAALTATAGLLGAGLLVSPSSATTTAAGLGSSPRASVLPPVKAAAVVTAPASKLALSVVAARDGLIPDSGGGTTHPFKPTAGDVVPHFKWQIQADNTGNPNDTAAHCHPSSNPLFPAGCDWPSIHSMDAAPVVSNGDETDWSTVAKLAALTPAQASANAYGLKPGKYLVSVVPSGPEANGYQIGGGYFTVPAQRDATSTDTATVQVRLNPLPAPLGTIQIQVFEDMHSANAQWDQQSEDGLSGFSATLADYLGGVTVDYFGNPLCTEYRTTNGVVDLDASGRPAEVTKLGGGCVSDADGVIKIPNLAPGRYGSTVTPPGGSTGWIQTTSLEGNRDHDIWLMQNDTGYDTELVVGGENVPWVSFGYVCRTGTSASPSNCEQRYQTPPRIPAGGTNAIKGVVREANSYIPGVGGLPFTAGGNSGLKLADPISDAHVALSDLSANDQTIWSGNVNPGTGAFDIKDVPDGDYIITVWNQALTYILDNFQISVSGGKVYDLGVVPLNSWFNKVDGHVYVDVNANGKKDPGEQGIPDFLLQILDRGNNIYEQGQQTATTDHAGRYEFDSAYPLGQFNVLQAFNTRYKTTGITWQACNDPKTHTVKTGAVDLAFLPIISQCGHVDWGVQPYDAANDENGGIAGTVFYEAERANYNDAQTFAPSYAVGVPGVTAKLYTARMTTAGRPLTWGTTNAVPAALRGSAHVAEGNGRLYQVGSVAPAAASDSYLSEAFHRPIGCRLLNANGVDFTASQDAVTKDPAKECVESPMVGMNFGLDADSSQTVDGNYALGVPTPGDYIVKIDVPKDHVIAAGAKKDHPLYKAVSGDDPNFNQGAPMVPQGGDYSQVDWPAVQSPNPMVTPANRADVLRNTGSYLQLPGTMAAAPDAQCIGTAYTVNSATNPSFIAAGGNPFDGQSKPTCDAKWFHVEAGQAVAPNFHIFTDVPLATKFSGLIIDDVNVTTDRTSTMLGEVRGVPHAPVGVYDWTGRLVNTVESDFNGWWETLVPSTDIFNCPTPSGICPLAYRFVGNDPGSPTRPNFNYNPAYRTISATFQSWPGNFEPADLAPTTAAASLSAPAAQFNQVTMCTPADEPLFFSVNDPVLTQGTQTSLTIKGDNLGTATGTVQLLDASGNAVGGVSIGSWSPTQVTATVDGSQPGGAYRLGITRSDSRAVVNTVTLQVIGGGYTPTVIKVGPGLTGPDTFDPATSYTTGIAAGLGAIQQALVRAAEAERGGHHAVVVVYPNTGTQFNPLGAYFENLTMFSPAVLQGVGPGGVTSGNVAVPGTVLDGRYFWTAQVTQTVPRVFNEPYAVAWLDFMDALQGAGSGWAGDPTVSEGAPLFVVSGGANPATGTLVTPFGDPSWHAGINGFTVQGGDQRDFPGNLNTLAGKQPVDKPLPGANATATVQGGAVFLNAFAHDFGITDNLVQTNSGAYGSIRVGTPYVENQSNDRVRIQHNRILANGGTNLAGAVGLFNGTNDYRIDHNTLCGNTSTEYGGAISQYGQGTGSIDHNKILLNTSIDEGGGVMIAGELPQSPTGAPLVLSKGAGPVSIDHNDIAANVANDDGGGIRLLMVGNHQVTIENNFITNNVSTHEGGGVSLDDAPAVRFAFNTVAKNTTTATAVTSDGKPAPAGLATSVNSDVLQATLPLGSPAFSSPKLVDNIFADNRAGSWDPSFGVRGIGTALDSINNINEWDMGVAGDGGYLLAPTNSILTSTTGTQASPTNQFVDPGLVRTGPDAQGNYTWTANGVAALFATNGTYDLAIDIAPWRVGFRFRPAAIVSVSLPANPLGDYHLSTGSNPAFNGGALTSPATTSDIDDQPRPALGGFDIGADERQTS
jgi:hypothetical protein